MPWVAWKAGMQVEKYAVKGAQNQGFYQAEKKSFYVVW